MTAVLISEAFISHCGSILVIYDLCTQLKVPCCIKKAIKRNKNFPLLLFEYMAITLTVIKLTRNNEKNEYKTSQHLPWFTSSNCVCI